MLCRLLFVFVLLQVSETSGLATLSSHVRQSTATNELRLSDQRELILQNLTMERCCHPFNESLYSFYRKNFHKKRNKKHVPSLPKPDEDCENDAVYIYRTSDGTVLAALRLTRSKQDSKYSFLRSLCVSRDYRGCRLSLSLLEAALDEFSPDLSSSCYCFASPYLQGLYKEAGFTRIQKSEFQPWPKWLIGSYNDMDSKWSRKTLGLFIKSPPLQDAGRKRDNRQTPMRVILLQHGLEIAKPTATGWLLDDKLYHEKYSASIDDEDVAAHVRLERWIWHGRNTTGQIEEQLSSLEETSRPVLLWTGGSDDVEESDVVRPNNDAIPNTFVVLDGTWQQAKKMYRRIPKLWKMSRVSLKDVPPSQYILRGDFSGWKDRFATSSNGDKSDVGSDNRESLLCTAEIVAALLDLQGNSVGGAVVRSRLDSFQTNYLQARKGGE